MSILTRKPKTKKAAASAAKGKDGTSASRAQGPRLAARSVVRRPWVSEKASRLEALGQYVFSVSDDATKTMVAEEVRRRYRVGVRGVSIVNKKGKTKRFRNRQYRRSAVKKAIVTLKAGDKIDLA